MRKRSTTDLIILIALLNIVLTNRFGFCRDEFNCLKCNNNRCLECVSGYTLERGECEECDVNDCAKCDSSISSCEKCLEGYYLKAGSFFFKDKCERCKLGCEECIDKDTCTRCSTFYELTEEGKCEFTWNFLGYVFTIMLIVASLLAIIFLGCLFCVICSCAKACIKSLSKKGGRRKGMLGWRTNRRRRRGTVRRNYQERNPIGDTANMQQGPQLVTLAFENPEPYLPPIQNINIQGGGVGGVQDPNMPNLNYPSAN